MKIGFVRGITCQAEMVAMCDKVVYAESHKNISDAILDFIEDYQEEELVFQSILELRLQISQLLPLLEKILVQNVTVYIIDRGVLSSMSQFDYLKTLLVLAQQEKEIRSICTKEALARVKRQGISIGRPAINQSIVAQIDFLYNNQGKSIREVATICMVSVGTVHKYLKQLAD